jgi:hypothetical protein
MVNVIWSPGYPPKAALAVGCILAPQEVCLTSCSVSRNQLEIDKENRNHADKRN